MKIDKEELQRSGHVHLTFYVMNEIKVCRIKESYTWYTKDYFINVL